MGRAMVQLIASTLLIFVDLRTTLSRSSFDQLPAAAVSQAAGAARTVAVDDQPAPVSEDRVTQVYSVFTSSSTSFFIIVIVVVIGIYFYWQIQRSNAATRTNAANAKP